MLKKSIIISVSLIVLIFLFNSVLMPLYVKHTKLVKVPNVVGMNFVDAKRLIEEAGLDVKQGDLRYDESKPVGIILDQNPLAEQFVKSGRRVYLIVCGGEQLIDVPKLTGKTLRDAKFTLEQRNLNIGEVAKKFSYDYAEDIVISQIIQPGSRVKKNTKVDLIISNGAQIGNIIVPDLVGKKLDDAKKIITDSKLKVGKITYLSSDLPPGEVIDQYPKKEKSAKENTEVELIIAKKRKEVKKEEEEIINGDNGKTEKEKQDEKDKNIEKEQKKEKQKETKEKDTPKETDKEKKTKEGNKKTEENK